jgi:hypothetical protein
MAVEAAGGEIELLSGIGGALQRVLSNRLIEALA